jgi:hypothetical protein
MAFGDGIALVNASIKRSLLAIESDAIKVGRMRKNLKMLSNGFRHGLRRLAPFPIADGVGPHYFG